jgi:hypothetical protein
MLIPGRARLSENSTQLLWRFQEYRVVMTCSAKRPGLATQSCVAQLSTLNAMERSMPRRRSIARSTHNDFRLGTRVWAATLPPTSIDE